MRAEAEKMMGGLFNEEDDFYYGNNMAEASFGASETSETVPVATSDAGFVDMVRTGVLALQLLPKNRFGSFEKL